MAVGVEEIHPTGATERLVLDPTPLPPRVGTGEAVLAGLLQRSAAVAVVPHKLTTVTMCFVAVLAVM